MGPERFIMFGAVSAWAVISLISRAWGGVVGALMGAAVGVWGHLNMEAGRHVTLAFMDRPLTRPAFFTIVSLLIVVNASTAFQGFRQRRARLKDPAGG